MKRIAAFLSALFLLPLCAPAEGFTYSATSVTDCAMARDTYRPFYEAGETGILIPGLAEGLTPQGICCLEQDGLILFSGYRDDGGQSALIASDKDTGEVVKEVFLRNTDGTPYCGHAGGVCATGRNIYVSYAGKLYRLSMEAFRALPASGEGRFEEEIPVPVNSSYCCVSDGVLWVGEFEYGAEYKTDRSHRTRTADGVKKAWTCGYLLTDDTVNGLKPGADGGAPVPDLILAMGGKIQGITFRSGLIYLSQSYGRQNTSILYRYKNVLEREPDSCTELNGQSIPVWYLDENVLDSRVLCPPMTECLCTVGNEILVLFESADHDCMDPKKPSLNPMDRVFRLTGF